jgi:MFS family permease
MQKLSSYIHQKFPTYGERNIFLFYMVSVFGHAWFMVANWLLFVLLFMNEQDFALFESIAFGAGILVEIPSGAIADLLGKRRTLIAAYSMQLLGIIGFLFASWCIGFIFFGNLIMIVSFALQSGALEALVYDTLLEKNKEQHYDEIIGKAHSLTTLSIIIASTIGGIAWTFSEYAPWVLTSIGFFVALIVSLKFIEPKIDSEVFSWKNFATQNKRGFYYLFKSDFRKYTFALVALSGSFLMWEVGIIRILMGRDFGYDGQTLSYLVAVSLLVSFFTSYKFKNIRKRLGNMKGYGAMLGFAGLAWLATGVLTGSLLLGAIVFTILTVTGSLAELWTSVILNEHVKSKDRATAISTMAFLIQAPYVFVVVLYGNLIATGNTEPFYIIVGVLLLVGLLSFYRAERTKIIVK